ncbi:uncharacterized protein LOC107043996 [Diachasma alloeum]|uniref:uncharacterized protein LOC107043996 n=1 Tax=Diachasma alloeum TaxID=454923 RepID=UPI0007381B3B|nr:uncharacterized protein LOC107043996 [Diachasma alloeum]
MEQLETKLEAVYGTEKSIDSLQMKISTLRQREGESVSSYGSRTERITAELVDELTKTNETLVQERTVEDAIRQLAKASFETGLNGQVQVLVRARAFKILHESVIGAIDLAKTLNLQSGKSQIIDGRRLEQTCYRCNLAGHFARDCPSRQASTRLP